MWQLGLRGGMPLLIALAVLAGPGIGARVLVDPRDPLPAEAVAIAQRPCELVERYRLVETSATDIRAFSEAAVDGLDACTYEAEGSTFAIGLLRGETLRSTRGPEFTQADFVAALVAADAGAQGLRGIGEGAVRTTDGVVWGRQGDLVVRVTATGLDASRIEAIARLALAAVADRY